MSPRREVFFLGTGAERRFCLISRPEGPPKGALLYVQPFAEELNRSRHMVARAVHAIVQAGWTVLQMDLHGCGDSEGDFGDATWNSWLVDLDRAHDWISSEGTGPIVVWSLRAGSLLAANWMWDRKASLPLLAWQPVYSGQQFLTQFLRIRLGADLAQSAQAKGVLSSLRASLKEGQPVSIGGYWLSATLAQGLEGASFEFPEDHTAKIALLEVAGGDAPELTPVTLNWLSKAQAAGRDCEGMAVTGQKFWQSAEIETAMALIAPTLATLQRWAP